jgi:2-polyprenyl-3-methyl-5-hydroxy-6-metoxy-1,4-benzoquinol methylase
MIISHLNCPLCNSDKLAEFLKAKDYLVTSEIFPLVKCQACGFIFTQGVPAAAEISRYYRSEDYVSHSDTRKGLMNKIYHLGRNFMLRKKFGMINRVAKSRRLLDIGCGTGYFPAFMQQKGYRATGVEVDPKAREFAEKQHGIKVHSPEEFLGERFEGAFDVITLWHVLEHLHDFNRYLEKMLEHLEKDGALVIALPNCSAFEARHYREYWAGYDVPRHLWHFTPVTLNLLAEKHGLKVVRMKRLPLDPFYNSMLSEKYKGNKFFMLSGTIIGKLAYIESLSDIKKSSSIVYFLKRKSYS